MCVREDVDIALHAILAINQTPNIRQFKVWQTLVLDHQKDIHHLGMGSASSVLQSEAGRPLDGSDVQTADEALEEVRRIRNILASASALPNHGSFTRMKMGTTSQYIDKRSAMESSLVNATG